MIIFIHQAFRIISAKSSADNIGLNEVPGDANLTQKYSSYLIQRAAADMGKNVFGTEVKLSAADASAPHPSSPGCKHFKRPIIKQTSMLPIFLYVWK